MKLPTVTTVTLRLDQQIALLLISALLFYVLAPYLTIPRVKAATFGATYVRLDRMAASTATTGLVCATTPGADTGTEGKVVVTFPAGFTLSETVADWTVATTDLPNGATAWPSIATATDASDTTKEVTFPSGDLSASTQYCFRWTDPDALTTSGAGNNLLGSIETLTAGDGALDTDSFALAVQDDQIGVTASIAQSFTFSTGSDIALGVLTPGSVNNGDSTVDISTNGANGWIAWVGSANGNLTSTLTSATIDSPGSVDNATTDLTGTTYGYLLDVIITTDGDGSGTVSQAANYGQEYDGGDVCATSTTGGTLSTTLQPIAASNGTTSGDQLTLCALVRPETDQAAASDYADTLTVVAAGRF